MQILPIIVISFCPGTILSIVQSNSLTFHEMCKLESGVVMLFRVFTVGEESKLVDKARLGDNPSMLGNYVSMTPGGVTFMGFNSYQEKFGTILAVDGVTPSRENILNGAYKLAATYYLIISGGENKDVAAFLEYVQSEEGKAVIGNNFIPYMQ